MSETIGLPEQWRLDVIAAGGVGGAREINDIMMRHAERHRRYHGREHLEALFNLLHKHAPHISAGTPPRLAVWWHDAIYDPQAHDNEERSAELARHDMRNLRIADATIEATVDLILITKNHWAGGSTGDGDYFLDADIAILGAPTPIYDQYAADVRQEYSWAPEAAFRAGRSAFLIGALARPRLFRTPVFEAIYSDPARRNMQRELAAFSGPAS